MDTYNNESAGPAIPPPLLAATKRRPALRSLLTEHPEIVDLVEESNFLCDALCNSKSKLSRQLFVHKSLASGEIVPYILCAMQQEAARVKDERIDDTDIGLAKVRRLNVDDLMGITQARSERDLHAVEEAGAKAKQTRAAYESEALKHTALGDLAAAEEAWRTAEAHRETEGLLTAHANAMREDLASDRAYFDSRPGGTGIARMFFRVIETSMLDAERSVAREANFEKHVAWFDSDDFLFCAHAAGIDAPREYAKRVVRGLRKLRAEHLQNDPKDSSNQSESQAERAKRLRWMRRNGAAGLVERESGFLVSPNHRNSAGQDREGRCLDEADGAAMDNGGLNWIPVTRMPDEEAGLRESESQRADLIRVESQGPGQFCALLTASEGSEEQAEEDVADQSRDHRLPEHPSARAAAAAKTKPHEVTRQRYRLQLRDCRSWLRERGGEAISIRSTLREARARQSHGKQFAGDHAHRRPHGCWQTMPRPWKSDAALLCPPEPNARPWREETRRRRRSHSGPRVNSHVAHSGLTSARQHDGRSRRSEYRPPTGRVCPSSSPDAMNRIPATAARSGAAASSSEAFDTYPPWLVYLDALWPRASARLRALMNTNWMNEFEGVGGARKAAALKRFIVERNRLASSEERRVLAAAFASRMLSSFASDANSLFMFVHDVEVAALLQIRTASELPDALRREVSLVAQPHFETSEGIPANEAFARQALDRDHIAAALCILRAHDLLDRVVS